MWRNKKGQGLVEMALVLPILLLLVLGIVEFGFLFATKLEIQHAARDGARMAAIGVDADDVKTNLQDGFVLLKGKIIDDKITITQDAVKKSVEVKVEYNYTPITGFIFNKGIDLTTSMSMRSE